MFTLTIYRIFKTSLISLWRNRWLSLASTLIMVITLITISIFASLSVITNKMAENLKDRIDMVAYIQDSATEDQVTALQKVIRARPEVTSVDYVSKEEALRIWQERNKDNENIKNIVNQADNPLPRSLEIKTEDPQDLDKIDSFLSSQEYTPLIKELSYRKNKDLIDKLIRITTFVNIAGWSLSLVFALISVLVIYNTIRLTIFARSEEIEIMKLVGATDWYIRGPFIVDGIAYGIAATIIASLLLYLAFQITIPVARNYLGGFDMGQGYLGVSFGLVIFLQFAVGVILGAVCSIVAVKKYLK
ncbi:MAG: permease-like cell division protein FtsX [Patescibacteria group bacterium]|jgi:cell division transport system permease protein